MLWKCLSFTWVSLSCLSNSPLNCYAWLLKDFWDTLDLQVVWKVITNERSINDTWIISKQSWRINRSIKCLMLKELCDKPLSRIDFPVYRKSFHCFLTILRRWSSRHSWVSCLALWFSKSVHEMKSEIPPETFNFLHQKILEPLAVINVHRFFFDYQIYSPSGPSVVSDTGQ